MLVPPCSTNAKWKPATLATACTKLGSPLTSALLRGTAGNGVAKRPGRACGLVPPKSGFWLSLRYLVHQLVSTVSCVRFVSLPSLGTPETWLGVMFLNGVRSALSTPLAAR